MKLDFIRLVTRELTHVIARRFSNNLNDSTFKITALSILECGLASEVKLVGGRVDFRSTMRQTKNNSYKKELFENMYNLIMVEGKRLERNENVDYVPENNLSKAAIDLVERNECLDL